MLMSIDFDSGLSVLIAATAAGGLLGVLYFGSLWITVRQLPSSKQPLVVYFGFLLLRLATLAVGLFGLLAIGGGGVLLAAVAGFMLVRLAALSCYCRTWPEEPGNQRHPADERRAAKTAGRLADG